MGTGANIFLFGYNVSPALTGHRIKPTHVILSHLAVANCMGILSTGIPQIMLLFGIRYPLSPLACKFVYCIRRVTRTTTLCSTTLLSTYQAVILNPVKKGWALIQGNVFKAVGPSCCTCWVFSVLTNIYTFLTTTNSEGTYNDSDTQGQWFCTTQTISTGFTVLWSTSDGVFIGLMAWASGSMVVLLWRHHHKMQHIHTFNPSHKRLQETRATHTILMLLVTFANFYVLNSIVVFYVSVTVDTSLWVMHASQILASSFPTLSPFLILRDPKFYS
ncbi:vomeronasal type-1 receptor 1-like [Rhynchocyon petersi]